MRHPIIRGPKQFKDGNQIYRITAVGGLHKIGDQAPYFSLTGDIDRAHMGLWVEDSGGCIHEEILKHWPELKPLADLHLSDMDGVPMHAAANAWHWLRGSFKVEMDVGRWAPEQPAEVCLQYFADHVRISLAEAQELRWAIRARAREFVSDYERVWEGKHLPFMEQSLNAWIEAQKPRWKAEAEAAIKDFGLVIF